MFKFSRSTTYCVCGGLLCVLVPAALVGVFAPLACKKHKCQKDGEAATPGKAVVKTKKSAKKK